MIFQLRQLKKNSTEIEMFHKQFCSKIKYEVPYEYFNEGDCFGILFKGRLVGGFCLVNAPPLHLRSLIQIPDIVFNWYLYDSHIYDVCEFTGYFIEDKRFGLLFTMYLVWVILTYNAKQFVYSYPVSQKGLEQYYRKGKPIRLYTGFPATLEGVPGVEKEHVELLTKWGIVKIFLFRTLRYFSWRYYDKRIRRKRSPVG